MLDTYIRTTTKIVHWLMLVILRAIEPFIRFIGIFLILGGLIGGLVMLDYGAAHGFSAPISTKHLIKSFMGPTYGDMAILSAAMCLTGLSLSLAYEVMIDRMFLDFFFPLDEEEETRSAGRKSLDWMVMLALLAGFTLVVRYALPKMMFFVWPIVGFALWVVVGVALGALSWFYRHGSRVYGVIGALFKRAAARIYVSRKISQARECSEAGKVLKFKKKA